MGERGGLICKFINSQGDQQKPSLRRKKNGAKLAGRLLEILGI